MPSSSSAAAPDEADDDTSWSSSGSRCGCTAPSNPPSGGGAAKRRTPPRGAIPQVCFLAIGLLLRLAPMLVGRATGSRNWKASTATAAATRASSRARRIVLCPVVVVGVGRKSMLVRHQVGWVMSRYISSADLASWIKQPIIRSAHARLHMMWNGEEGGRGSQEDPNSWSHRSIQGDRAVPTGQWILIGAGSTPFTPSNALGALQQACGALASEGGYGSQGIAVTFGA